MSLKASLAPSSVKTKVAVLRFVKVTAAAIVALLIQKIPVISTIVPFGAYGAVLATAILSGLEKYLRSGK